VLLLLPSRYDSALVVISDGGDAVFV